MGLLIDPLVSFDAIGPDDLNACLDRWEHKMGPLNRPLQYGGGAHGIRHDGRLVAVTAWSTLVRETCAGMEWLPRDTTTELSRVCAERRNLCRLALRLWREFAFPAIREARGHDWAVSYQDTSLHAGDLYRFDGWVKLGRFKSGGKDPRTGRKGRSGWIWGWHPDPAERARRALTGEAQDALRTAA
jgi:antitoxin VapB